MLDAWLHTHNLSTMMDPTGAEGFNISTAAVLGGALISG